MVKFLFSSEREAVLARIEENLFFFFFYQNALSGGGEKTTVGEYVLCLK